ncbi:eCIS core domain-containing protein [Streptomyces sp. R-07]|uniref:eCIS core domain-containing protein n=1 Tax=Streptomyces sp. R-07 TaxID=3404052 RepID=UPI003CF8328C
MEPKHHDSPGADRIAHPAPRPARQSPPAGAARLAASGGTAHPAPEAAARASAAEVGARAYTSGSPVVVGGGGGDRHTLAHELMNP